LEYLVAETLELASKSVNAGSNRVTPRVLTLAVRHDQDLGALLHNVTISRGGVTGMSIDKNLEKLKKAQKKATKKTKPATPAA